MSTDYRPLSAISFSELFGGALEPFHVRERISEGTTGDHRCLTDGDSCVWAFRAPDGSLEGLTRWYPNRAENIVRAIHDAFGVEVVSEHEPLFWGFATEEEWCAAMESWAAEHSDELYEQAIRDVCGEGHKPASGTIEMTLAEIAKALMADDPDLARPESKNRLLEATKSAYLRIHSTTTAPIPF